MARILFGLDRLPRTMEPDDPRLPGVPATGGVLRLNTEPLPAGAMVGTMATAADHAARLAAMRRWLEGLCGDYAPARRRFVAVYCDLLAAAIAAHRAELAAGLARFDGLYAPEDWLWSAPRPLPRAWVPAMDGLAAAGPAVGELSMSGPTMGGPAAGEPAAGELVFAEIAFRLGNGPLALVLAEPEREAALRTRGIPVCRIGPDVLAGGAAALGDVLGSQLGPILEAGPGEKLPRFRPGECLPVSPFRRAVPGLPGG
ncbi:MAG: hypothetical protein ACREFY_01530 [Acetobacteraceae bacterium]